MVRLDMNRVLMVLSGMLLIAVFTMPAGSAAADGGASLKAADKVRPMFVVPQRWPDKYDLVLMVSKGYGVSFSSLLNYCNQGGRLEDACRIAYMAKAANLSFDQVASMKGEKDTWNDVFKKIGISESTIREYRKSAAADMLKRKYGIEPELARSLIEQRYNLGDLAKAGQLALQAKMDVREVLAMKKVNNSWEDVKLLLGDKIPAAA